MNNEKGNFLSDSAQRSRAMARLGIQEVVSTADTPREYAPLLLGVHGLLNEAENALGCYQLATKVNLIPAVQPSGSIVAQRVEAEGAVFNPGATNWDEIREVYEPVLRRALWGYALLKFCAAMPRYQKPAAKHTDKWLKTKPEYRDDFNRFSDIRNWQEAHAGSEDAPKGGKISEFEALTVSEGATVSFEEWAPDPTLNYDPTPEDGLILRLLIMSASEFTTSEIRKAPRND